LDIYPQQILIFAFWILSFHVLLPLCNYVPVEMMGTLLLFHSSKEPCTCNISAGSTFLWLSRSLSAVLLIFFYKNSIAIFYSVETIFSAFAFVRCYFLGLLRLDYFGCHIYMSLFHKMHNT
jgi:hypothetical protein